MSLEMKIESALDQRSADQAADQAVRTFTDAGTRASEGFNTALNRGMNDTRFADSTGMKARFEAWVGQSGDAGKKASEEFGTKFAEDMPRHGETAAARLIEGFSSGLGNGIPGVGNLLSGLTRAGSEMGAGISAGGLVAAAGVAAIAAAAVVVGDELYKVGERFDAITDGLAIRTGKTGEELNSLADSVNRVGTYTASSLEQIGDIAGRVSQSFDVSGAPLEKLTSQIADLDRMTGENLNVRAFGQTMRGFGEDANSASSDLDRLYDASTRTGVPVNELVSDLQGLGPSARAMGLDINQTAGLIAAFDQAGSDATSTVSGLNQAAQVFAQNSIPLKTGLEDTITQLKGFIDAGDEASALDLAGKVFGTENAQKFVDLIEQGKLDVDKLREGLSNTGTTIDDVKDRTAGLHEEWQKVKNRVSEIAEMLGTPVFQTLNNLLGGDSGLTPQEAYNRGRSYGGAAAGLVPPPDRPDNSPPGAYDTGSGQHMPGSPAGPHDPWDIAGILDDKNKKNPLSGVGKKGRAGSQTPSIPTDQYSLDKLPAGSFEGETPPGVIGPSPFAPGTGPQFDAGQFVVDPQKKYAAETREIGARNALEQARVHLLELEAKGDATEQDLQAAKDRIQQSERSWVTAGQELADATQGTWKKLSDSVKQAHGDMQTLGAAIDQDFGISKGLPGIADNLTRFIANLAAAPALGQLAAKSTGDAGGFGLIGQAAAQGAFGPQYTGTGGYGSWTPQGSQTAPPGVSPSGYPGAVSGPIGGDKGSIAQAIYSAVTSQGYSPGVGTAAVQAALLESSLNPGARNQGHNSLFQTSADKGVPDDPAAQIQWLLGEMGRQGGPAAANADPLNFMADKIERGGYPGSNYNQFLPQAQSLLGPGMGPIAAAHAGDPQMFGSGRGIGFRRDAQSTDASGVHPQISAVQQIARQFGLDLTSGRRNEPGSYHNTGEAGDFSNGDQTAQETAFANFMAQNYGPYISELIHQGPGTAYNVKDGKLGPVIDQPGSAFNTGQAGYHGNHDHLAISDAMAPGFMNAAQGSGVQIGGLAPPGAVGGGGGGIGITPGGSVDSAIGAAASMFPGVGQAAQTGMKLANRAIQYAGQVAGIGMSGLMETFLPTGGSELANNSWLTRIVGGLAGAKPALPNTAGKSAQQPQPQQGQGQQPGGNTVINNATVNNHGATENQNAKTLGNLLQSQAEGPGM